VLITFLQFYSFFQISKHAPSLAGIPSLAITSSVLHLADQQGKTGKIAPIQNFLFRLALCNFAKPPAWPIPELAAEGTAIVFQKFLYDPTNSFS
jgi:hypothetical protein